MVNLSLASFLDSKPQHGLFNSPYRERNSTGFAVEESGGNLPKKFALHHQNFVAALGFRLKTKQFVMAPLMRGSIIL